MSDTEALPEGTQQPLTVDAIRQLIRDEVAAASAHATTSARGESQDGPTQEAPRPGQAQPGEMSLTVILALSLLPHLTGQQGSARLHLLRLSLAAVGG